ncbi:MAG: T9SS type A sorting domain-containing protein [Candidatus Marinimicrobia bacterium]|jgi:chitinase|nr:T9SS type A sorting domain-containing protein [Candidatus Neomarinimicrobiota bacterium]MBT3574600.1 T9SS type A sorting domain-containing protein [Candidatus Neomarinimicrobiota bacterium]MBT3680314.1 T9SS type A sorting domain-containing protein [Candidatus Neomarinimicrobiota bacterium]MBT3950922.1 T9SS type A sorting domain-containing protein [Candidatus Neomarinimicrobiota bacterium]MBT4252230.1 T9SS type A sorting domain-containing protein [Candidatus Neomarinimicrobiota bacterium]
MHRIIRVSCLLILFNAITGTAQNRVVGYYPDWVIEGMPAEELDFGILTHVNHAFAWPTATGEINSYLNMFDVDMNVTIHENGGYISLSFGGWGNSDGFAPMTASPENRQNFITNVIETCQYYEYDGVDFDWEHPATSTETDNYTLLIQELRAATDTTFDNFLITMAVPAGNWSGQHYDLDAMEPYIDWFNAMTYDYHGTWTNHAGHNSPLYNSPSNDPDGSCHTSMNYLINSRHIDPQKLNMGIPFYAKEFGASEINGASTGGNLTYGYNDIVGFLDQGWTDHWDDVANAPYLQNAAQTRLITYDNPTSVGLKCDYANSRDLGGVMIWALGQDFINGHEELLEAIQDYSGTIQEGDRFQSQPAATLRISNYPNPFNPITTISYFIPEQSKVEMTVYDIHGRALLTLLSGQISPGTYQIVWDGLDGQLRQVSTGIYFCKLQAGSFTKTIKMLFIK